MEHPIGQPQEKCSHFTIRGFVADVREKSERISFPFPPGTELPPIRVPEFRFWKCLEEENAEENVNILDDNNGLVLEEENVEENVKVVDENNGPVPSSSTLHEEYPPGVYELLLLRSHRALKDRSTEAELGSAGNPINIVDDDTDDTVLGTATQDEEQTTVDAEKNTPVHTADGSQETSDKKASKRKRVNSSAARKGKKVAAGKTKLSKRRRIDTGKNVNQDASTSSGGDAAVNHGVEASTSAVGLSAKDNWKIRKPRTRKPSPVMQNLPQMETFTENTVSGSGACHEVAELDTLQNNDVDALPVQQVAELDTLQNNDVDALPVQQSENQNDASHQAARRGLDVDLNLIPMDEEDEEQFIEAIFLSATPPAADNHAEGELPATSANNQTVSSSVDKGKSVVVERVILRGGPSQRSREEFDTADFQPCGTPSVSTEPPNTESSCRRTMHSGPETPMAGEQIFPRRVEIVDGKLPLILPESPSKTPSILLKSKDRRGNRASGQQSMRASELKANAASKHAGLSEMVELMTKNLYEKHPSAFSQYLPRPSTIGISGGYGVIPSLPKIHEAAASQAQVSFGCSSDVSGPIRSQPLTGSLADMGRMFPWSSLQSSQAYQTSRSLPQECSSRHDGLAQISTRPYYLDPHFDNRNWGLERNKGQHPHYPYGGIDTGVRINANAAPPVDMFNRNPMPAPLLPRLMDAGMRPGIPADVDKNRMLYEQSIMHHNHHRLEVSRFGHFWNNRPLFPPPTSSYFRRNYHPGSFRGKSPIPGANTVNFPAPVLLNNINFSSAPAREINRLSSPLQNRNTTGNDSWFKSGFPSRLSTNILRDPVRGKSKIEEAPVQSLRSSSNIYLSENGNPETNRSLASTVYLPQGPLSTPLVIKNSTNQLESVGKRPGTVCLGKRNRVEELCTVNRNPAEFMLPEGRNKYMIGESTIKVSSARRKQGKRAKITSL